MTLYLWIKTFHLVFVIAFMAAVFYLPRILVNLGEAGNQAPVRERLVLMGRRLYRFGHVMFGLSLILGLVLWFGYRVLPDFPTMVAMGTGWMHAKLALVVAVFVYYIVCGRRLKSIGAGGALPRPGAMRIINELPVLALVAIVWLVLAKPF
ncbi:CopD family protein [Denitratimonas sp. CY0512]|uniref:CopD family protein n=1 Tax=Denitratimonas sp. CY0512 TaxID=3131940 RepID=UPI00309AC3B2